MNQLKILAVICLLLPGVVFAQSDSTLLEKASLQEVIRYALKNKPGVQQSVIDEQIGEREIKSALSGWLPQISGDGTASHNFKQQTTILTNNGVSSSLVFGAKNTSSFVLQADQKILDAGLIQASKTAKYFRQQYKQNTESTIINTVVDVSKAFYDILTSKEQIKIVSENIARLEKQAKDAKAQYEAGLVDKTDFQRAQISLGNAKADLKRTTEMLKYKNAYLRELIGYNTNKDLDLAFSEGEMERNISIDTNQTPDFRNRVEYRLLQTQKEFQRITTSYNKWNYVPSLSGFYNYGWNFQSQNLRSLYDQTFPSSVVGLKLNIPIFQGGKRTQEIRKSQLQEKRIELDLVNTKNQINTQYESAMATYKANRNDLNTAKSNVEISKQVYSTIKLQYDEGIKTYLDLMTSESDLRTAQLNYLNALYSLLSSRLDVQQALGTISIN